MSEPKSSNLQKILPEGVEILDAKIEGDIVYINFSEEFIENQEDDIEKQKIAVYSIVNTLSELSEVNGIKILINGEEECSFKNDGLSLKDIFLSKN